MIRIFVSFSCSFSRLQIPSTEDNPSLYQIHMWSQKQKSCTRTRSNWMFFNFTGKGLFIHTAGNEDNLSSVLKKFRVTKRKIFIHNRTFLNKKVHSQPKAFHFEKIYFLSYIFIVLCVPMGVSTLVFSLLFFYLFSSLFCNFHMFD